MDELLSFGAIKLIPEKSTHSGKCLAKTVLFGNEVEPLQYSSDVLGRSIFPQDFDFATCSAPTISIIAPNGYAEWVKDRISTIKTGGYSGKIIVGSISCADHVEEVVSWGADAILMADNEITFTEILEAAAVSSVPIIVSANIPLESCIKALVAGADIVISSYCRSLSETNHLLTESMQKHNVYSPKDLISAKWRIVR